MVQRWCLHAAGFVDALGAATVARRCGPARGLTVGNGPLVCNFNRRFCAVMGHIFTLRRRYLYGAFVRSRTPRTSEQELCLLAVDTEQCCERPRLIQREYEAVCAKLDGDTWAQFADKQKAPRKTDSAVNRFARVRARPQQT